jgi:hypothetical protein
MKKLILSAALVSWGLASQAQVVCAVQSPTNIAGNYTFTWADPAGGWGTPDFLIPNTFVEDTLVLVNDGTPGTNATYGNLLAEESCNPSPANAYAGKIAVLRRNTCEFGVKALNAQNAGAVAVIVVNREPSVLDMGAGAQGANVTIPVIMLSSTDGQLLIDQMLNGPVVAFIGNKTGLFADDAGITKSATLIAKSVGVPSQLAQNGSEFNFEIGTRVYNYGTSPQNNVTVTAEVTDPTGMTVYNQSVSLSNMPSGDSIDIFPGGSFSFPLFSLPTYMPGRYTLTYNVSLGTPDEYDADNTISSDFVINDNIFTYAQIDTVTGLPVSNAHYRPSTNNSTFATCMTIDNPNASRIAVTGIYFSATTTSTVSIEGEEIALNLYRWEDVFNDLNDANLGFTALNSVASGFYNYPNDSTTAAALQGEMVYGAFTTPFVLEDGQRFLACAQTVNTSLYLGHDSKTNYLWNEGLYLQPLTPNESDGAYFASGFGMDVPSAMGLSIVDAAEVGIAENSIEGMAYPNPAKDKVTISLNANGKAQLTVTDITGKIALNQTIQLENGKTVVSTNDLDAGVYIFNVQLEDRMSSQFQVVKK